MAMLLLLCRTRSKAALSSSRVVRAVFAATVAARGALRSSLRMPLEQPLTERFTRALTLACDLHRTQARKGTQIPYVAHLLGVDWPAAFTLGAIVSLTSTPQPVTPAARQGSGRAVAVNVTVTGNDAVSYLTVYPNQDARPVASDLNWVAGQTVANMVVVKLSDDGYINLYNAFGKTHVIVDVVGFFVEEP